MKNTQNQKREQLKMKVIFIRHAKSVEYDNGRRQTHKSELGELGIKQAEAVAERLSLQKVDVLFSSHWTRAKQTAEIISKKVGLPVKVHRKIHEFGSNLILAGKALDSAIVRRFEEEVKEGSKNFDWSFMGKGECMRDIIKRAQIFREDLLREHKGKNVLVVSHGFFIATFTVLCLLGDNYDDATFKKLIDAIRFKNTSVSILEYDEEKNLWEIKLLNDCLHCEKAG